MFVSVSAWSVSEWIIAIAAVITALGIIYRKAIKPLMDWCREVADLTRRVVQVVERVEGEWSPAMTLLRELVDKNEALQERLDKLEKV